MSPDKASDRDEGLSSEPSRQPFDRRWSALKLSLGAALVVASLVFGYQYGVEVRSAGSGTISVSDAVQCLQAGADLYFNVTLGTEAYLKRLGEWEHAKDRLQTAQVFVLSANTHVGAITNLNLDNHLYLLAGGREYPAVGKTLALTKHHNTYLAYFPRRGMSGEPLFERESGSFHIVIRDVGKLKSRIFRFNFPLPTYRDSSQLEWKQILMLLGAMLAALLISCTPCLVGTLALGSFTMGAGWGESERRSARQVQKQMMRKTIYFLMAVSGGYLTIAVAVSSLGVQVKDLRPIEIFGGLVLVSLGLWMLRDLRPVGWLLGRAQRLLPARFRSSPTLGASVGAGSSSAMGGSLAMLCSVAGAPTLTTSIVVPVMIYAGVTSLAWAFLIIAAFLLISTVPFFFIATGMGELLYSLSSRWHRRILLANSVLLVALGTIMLFSSDHVANVISAPAELVLDAWRWIAT